MAGDYAWEDQDTAWESWDYEWETSEFPVADTSDPGPLRARKGERHVHDAPDRRQQARKELRAEKREVVTAIEEKVGKKAAQRIARKVAVSPAPDFAQEAAEARSLADRLVEIQAGIRTLDRLIAEEEDLEILLLAA